MQVIVIIIFTSILVFLFFGFLYPETSMELINNFFGVLQSLELKEIIIFALIAVVILTIAIILVLFHFSKIFQEREV